jgi:hypothetical protein
LRIFDGKGYIPIIATVLALLLSLPGHAAPDTIDIGSRLELFVDDFLIEKLAGAAAHHLHKPVPRGVALVTDAPWEGNTCAYYTVFQDGDLLRMYYRGWHFDRKTEKPAHRELTCYAESRDGVHWTKPNLGLFEFDGSKENNIVWDGIGCHNFTPFRDPNPACSPEARYKALGRENRPGKNKRTLFAFQSPDGIHWSLMQDKPVITKGAFDSQNLAFWDPIRAEYREYHRTFRDGVRDIQTAATQNFLEWPDPIFLNYPGAPKQHLYTNAVQPYFRAPHLFIAFPTRYLPKEGQRVEPILMTSRDGRTFRRWNEPVIPESAPKDRAGNRSNYMACMAWGVLQSPGNPGELSVYASEAYYEGPDSRLRRFTYRTDGFVSIRAADEGGEILTKPILFEGGHLHLNFATKNKGSISVEVQDTDGNALDGFRLEDCVPLEGDSIEKCVAWKSGDGLEKHVGTPVRLRIVLESADLFALRFR